MTTQAGINISIFALPGGREEFPICEFLGEEIFGMLNTFQKIKEEKSRFPTYFGQVMTIKTAVSLKRHVVHNGSSCIVHTIQSEMNIIDQKLSFSSSQLREEFFFWEGRVSNFHRNIYPWNALHPVATKR